ncbi:MAG: hypothetical protein AAB590_01145 [Patescibacteria group bacterium]
MDTENNSGNKGLYWIALSGLIVGLITLIIVYKQQSAVRVNLNESDAAGNPYMYDEPLDVSNFMDAGDTSGAEFIPLEEGLDSEDLAAEVINTTSVKPSFEIDVIVPSDPIYIDAPTILVGSNITPVAQWATKTPGSYQGESAAGMRLTMVSGPSQAMIQANGGIPVAGSRIKGDGRVSFGTQYLAIFTAPGDYVLRYTYTLWRTPIDKTRPPTRYLCSNNTCPIYPTLKLPPEIVTKDITVTVLDKSVATDQKASANPDIKIDAGKDQSARTNKAIRLSKHSYVTKRCLGKPAGYCNDNIGTIGGWTKISGPGAVTFTGSFWRCTTGANYGESCTTRKFTKAYYPSFDTTFAAKFSAPGTYVLRYAVYDTSYGYAYDDKVVTVK